MATNAILLTAMVLLATGMVHSAKQQVQLSDSYLPVAMQVIAHLTDQMAFESKDEPTTTKPTKATTTPRPLVTSRPGKPTTSGWWTQFTTKRPDQTTPYHKPGLYAPATPPKPSDRHSIYHRYVLLPPQPNSQYTILEPEAVRTGEPLLSMHQEEFKPLVMSGPNAAPLLPPHYDVKISSRSDGYLFDDISEDSLQYLSEDVRDMIKMAKNPYQDKVVDVIDGRRQGSIQSPTKAKLSQTNLRLLLLYDLLSRDAKKQRLNDYYGFSPDVMKSLVDSSAGGAREQLKMALSKMVERQDCSHQYANNRAKEMVEELGKSESLLSSELRYLQPLIYKY